MLLFAQRLCVNYALFRRVAMRRVFCVSGGAMARTAEPTRQPQSWRNALRNVVFFLTVVRHKRRTARQVLAKINENIADMRKSQQEIERLRAKTRATLDRLEARGKHVA